MKNVKVAMFIATFILSGNLSLFAQKHDFGVHEYGGFVSNSFYKGSLTSTPNAIDLNPAFTFFYRRNNNPVTAIRTQLSYLSLSYSDKNWSTPLHNARNTAFSTDIFELAFLGEYNFFDYRGDNKRVTWSPYLVGGICGFINMPSNVSEPAYGFGLPIGFGLKSNLGKQWNIGVEFLARKTLTDSFDSVSDLTSVNGYQAGDVGRTDWYYTLGLFLSYTKYSVNCPKY